MKFTAKYIIFVLLILAIISCSDNPPIEPETVSLSAIDVYNNQRGLIVGTQGVIFLTTNSGLNWAKQTAPTNLTLTDVQIIDDNIAWAVGESGIVLQTTDGGYSWQRKVTKITQYLISLYFKDANNGFIVGDKGLVGRTSDAGLNWVFDTLSTNQINSISESSAGNLLAISQYASDSLMLYTSKDAGLSWSKVNNTLFNKLSSYDITFVDDKIGFICSENRIFKTTDGGDTWQLQFYALDFEQNDNYLTIEKLQFASEQKAWFVGYYGFNLGVIFHSENGGNTWLQQFDSQAEGKAAHLFDIDFFDEAKGFAVGGYGYKLLSTSDGGNTWEMQELK